MLEDVEATAGLLPDHLKEGWMCYRDWWVARYRSGDPLPPGGVFILNRRAILMDELFRLHVEAAHGLGVPFDNITVDLDVDAAGRPVPRVDVRPPPGWMPDVPKRVIMAGGDCDKLKNEYVTGFLNMKYRHLQERLSKRLKSLVTTRDDVAQEVIHAQAPATAGGVGQGGSPS
jgi:hypothetical protein